MLLITIQIVIVGTLRHGSSHATHVYVNPQIPETIELMNP